MALDLGPSLREVCVESNVVATRNLPCLCVRLLRRYVDALDAEGRRDEGIVLLLGDERLRVLQRAPVLRRERFVQGNPGKETAHPGLPNGPGDLVLPIEEIVKARRAGANHLDASKERADLDVAAREFRVDRGRLRDHLFQRHGVPDPAQERVRAGMLEVDEARQDRGTSTIDDLVRLPIHGTDSRDPAIFYEHVTRDEAALRILRDDEPTTEEERHSRRLRWVPP